ncbi:MAG: addiction module protein [Micavibrio aeruginosavorus]|uniref:Addiction module protein n=1 Tax=Micavibrio aeruginosavorus TaxID=349221 RepID=A0A2W5A734_9BACT|nr:MAG: addiction module protein [Micavibrio aeruginosavorus]
MAQSVTPKTVVVYVDARSRKPFTEWVQSLKDIQAKRRIAARLRRVSEGNYGDYKHVQDGVYELRLFFGPGYRVYFGEDGDTIVVLLCGGDKGSQEKDIEAALAHWKEYQDGKKISDA